MRRPCAVHGPPGCSPIALLIASALLGTVLAGGSPAAADPAVSPADVHRALGIDNVPADYVLLVDTSASMHGPRYDAVRSTLRTFLASVAPIDQVTLVTFATDAVVVAQGPAGRSPDAIVDKLPADAIGSHTDIGQALEKAVTVLARDGAPTIGTVVLLTDGRHQPAAGSAYPFESGYAWDQLRRQAKDLRKEPLTAFAIPLAGVTGAGLLGKVFPTAKILSERSIDQVSVLLEEPKQAVQAAKARRILGPDSSSAVTVVWPNQTRDLDRGESRLPVTVRSGSTHIPFVVDRLAVASTTPAVHARVDRSEVAIAPGQSAQVVIIVTWNPGPRDWKPLATATVNSGLTLSGTISSPWAEALSADGVTLTAKLTGGSAAAHGSVQNGQLWAWIMALVGLLALVAFTRAGLRRRAQPALAGTLVARGAARSLPLRGRQATISQATLGIPGTGTVRRRRHRLLSHRTQLEIAYSRDGHPDGRETKLLDPNEPDSVSGVEFEWRTSS